MLAKAIELSIAFWRVMEGRFSYFPALVGTSWVMDSVTAPRDCDLFLSNTSLELEKNEDLSIPTRSVKWDFT